MIVTIKHKGLKKFWETGSTRGVQQDHVRKLNIILTSLDVAQEIKDVDLPSFKLHQLKGDQKGRYAIWVNGNWRVTFEFENSNVYLVDYEDYH